MAVTADNMFNNWTMCVSLAYALPAFQGTKSYVRCFVHILNLIVMVRCGCSMVVSQGNIPNVLLPLQGDTVPLCGQESQDWQAQAAHRRHRGPRVGSVVERL